MNGGDRSRFLSANLEGGKPLGTSDKSDSASARRAALLSEALAHVVEEYRDKSYQYWRDLVRKEPILLPHPNDDTVEIEVSPILDGGDGPSVRVLVSILHTTRFGISMPTASFLVDPEDHVVTPSS
jgi:hypothetical protein